MGLYRVGAVVFLITTALSAGREIYFIQQQIATLKALEACNSAYRLQLVEQPTETHAHLAAYWGSLVWVIEMKGKWILVSGPFPDPSNPAPFYWDECTIIIDALTGESKSPN